MHQWSITFRSRIEALMAEATVTDDTGAVVAQFRVYQQGDTFVVVALDGATVTVCERWDAAARAALTHAHTWVEHAFDAAPLSV